MREIVAIIFGLGLLVNAGLFLPQSMKIFRNRSAKGVSILTFAGFNVLQITGVLHGYYQNDPSLIIGMFASFIACFSVTFLSIVYRNR